jgi:hypothetical protein
MFRLNRWSDPQPFQPDRFDQAHPPVPQDIKQVWFAGVHADIGGGYRKRKALPRNSLFSGCSRKPLITGLRSTAS